MANPTLLKTPIASGGDKNTIPETTGSTTGLLSQEKGWQQINSLPINAGGIAPSRLDFNGVFNLLSNILFYAQKGWVWEFDETQNYFAGCTVKDTADGKTYVCIADVNASTTHPSADTTHWKLSDLATKDDLTKYLPLAGGSMTGTTIKRDADDTLMQLIGGSDTSSAQIQLFGKSHSSHAGEMWFIAEKPNASASLIGIPTGSNAGTLTWCGANVLTDLNGGYLPLAGGTMTGSEIYANNSSHYLELHGGPASDDSGYFHIAGSQFQGGDDSAGRFVIKACAGSIDKYEMWLEGYRKGELKYFTKDSGGNFIGPYDLSGASIVAKNLGTTGYTKRADGLIIQWGTVTPATSSPSAQAVVYPITFPTACFNVNIQSVGSTHSSFDYAWVQVKDVTTTGFTFSLSGTVSETSKYWFAIGH